MKHMSKTPAAGRGNGDFMSSIQHDMEKSKRSAKWQHFDRVIRDPTISPAARLLYVILFTYADDAGKCWPSIDVLAKELGYSRSGVKKLLNELLEAGVVKKRRRGKMLSNLYWLWGVMDTPVTITQKSDGHSSDLVMDTGVTTDGHSSDHELIQLTNPINRSNLNHATDVAGEKKKSFSVVGKKKKSPPKQKEQADPRVQPVLTAFYQNFKSAVGKEPTPQAFDWARDGKRVRQLPADYDAELLGGLVEKFFKAPGFVVKQYSFKNFLDAIPKLLKEDFTHEPKRIGPVAKPSTDFSDWQ